MRTRHHQERLRRSDSSPSVRRLPSRDATRRIPTALLTLHRVPRIILAAAMVCAVHGNTLYAQPALLINRIDLNWPQIALLVNVKCGEDHRTDVVPANFLLTENGSPMDNFTVHCYGGHGNFCISAALVIDKSGSMRAGSPSLLEYGKSCAQAFVDAMDPDGSGCDEAIIVAVDTTAVVCAGMTNDKNLLKHSMDPMTPGGGTDLWDGAIAGLLELVKQGTQEVRCLLLLTDGGDTGSSATPDDLIALALLNRIPLYCIGLGKGIDDPDLQRVAHETGGKFYGAPLPAALVQIYKDVSALIAAEFSQCRIEYTGNCPDGQPRTVGLTLQRLLGCPGTSTATTMYLPPRDTAAFLPVTFSLGSDSVGAADVAIVPLRLEDPSATRIPPFSLQVGFDTSSMSYIGYAGAGCALDSIACSVTQPGDTLHLRTSEALERISDAPLLYFLFAPRNGTGADVPLLLRAFPPVPGCVNASFASGNIHFQPDASIEFPPPGSVLFGGKEYVIRWLHHSSPPVSLELSNDGGISYILVANGIMVDSLVWRVPANFPSGAQYRFRIRGMDGSDRLVGASFFTIDQPRLILRHPADITACAGYQVQLTAAADDQSLSPARWQKSTDRGTTWKRLPGIAGDTLHIPALDARDDGSLYRALYSSYFSVTETRAAEVTVISPPDTIRISGGETVCPGGTARFTASANGTVRQMRWQLAPNGGGWSDMAGEKSDSLILRNVSRAMNGSLIRAVASNACGALASPAAKLTVPSPPAIRRQPLSLTVREKDSVALSVGAEGAGLRFVWRKDGLPLQEETDSLLILSPIRKEDAGTYRVIVRGACGSVVSDSAVIVVEPATSVASLRHAPGQILSPAYPNPFSSSTSIIFAIDSRAHVSLRICDLHGRRTRVLLAEEREPGAQMIAWDGRDDAGRLVGPGVYFALLEIDGKLATRRLTVIR